MGTRSKCHSPGAHGSMKWGTYVEKNATGVVTPESERIQVQIVRPNRGRNKSRGISMKRRGHRPTVLPLSSAMEFSADPSKKKPSIFSRAKGLFQRKAGGS